MKSQLSSRDWEYLSAYLDRQLKPKETASLEARLSADPVLSAALGELQRTRDALRGLPRLRAPRNFTLTPQMVGQRSSLRTRPANRLAPVFGFASALATFLLVLVIAGDFLGILRTSTSQPVALAPAPITEAASVPAVAMGEEAVNAKQAAPSFDESPQPTTAAAETAPMLQAPQTFTATTEMLPALASTEPTLQADDTPAMRVMVTETETTAEAGIATDTAVETELITTAAMTETFSAKTAAGMGGGMTGEMDESLSLENAIQTSAGLMWNTTLSLTVSPTETLMFPMTVTMEGPGISATYASGMGGGTPEEGSLPTEPVSTAAPEELPVPVIPEQEPTLAAPGGEATPSELQDATALADLTPPVDAGDTPEAIAVVVETPAVTQPELPTLNTAPPQTLVPGVNAPQSPRTVPLFVRVIEISLALLALLSALAACYIWWTRRL